MKKVVTLCLFAFTMLIGSQVSFAQNKVEINEKASVKAKELRAQLKLDENAIEQVYLAYQAYENKSFSIEKHLTKGTAEYKKANTQIQQRLQASIKNAIGDDLFQTYLDVTKQEEIIIEAQLENKSASQSKSKQL